MIDPQSNKTTGFHLFFEPEGILKDELAQIIRNLDAEYDGPVFTPHVTLLACIVPEVPDSVEGIIEKTEVLVKELHPFTLTLGTCAAQDAYYKALYIEIQEQKEMKALHARASEIFSMTDESPYGAHLSLLYGNYPEEQKQKTIESLILPVEHSFVVNHLYLYKTEGEVQDWELIKKFSIGD
ncbi:MAG: 2'-5' RNA ligase family protein [Candidatus Paceibacterota bacterium]